MNSIASRIAYARSLTQLDQKAFALECQITQQGLNKIESGKTLNPSSATLKKVSDRTGVRLEWLAFGGSNPFGDIMMPLENTASDTRAPYAISEEHVTELEAFIQELRLSFHGKLLPIEIVPLLRDLINALATHK